MKRVLYCLTFCWACGPLTQGATINFEKQLWPVLKDNCLACHNKTTTKGELNMETPALMIQGGENGKGIEAGHFDAQADAEQFAQDVYGIMLAYHHHSRLMSDPRAEERARRAFDRLLTQVKR